MKIHLLGEYSGFHTTLRDGLRVLGHEAVVIGSGDGSKAIPVDWNIGASSGWGVGTMARIAKALHFVATAPRVDVLQVINPHVFPLGWGVNTHLLRRLRRKSPRMFLSACGDDAVYIHKGAPSVRYSPVSDAVAIDLGLLDHPLSTPSALKWNNELAQFVDGIIPVMHEYEIGYAGYPKLRSAIPLPVNTAKILHQPNRFRQRLVVMHGAGRLGAKGSRHILEAFRILDRKHPGFFEFMHIGNLPIQEYLNIMARVNVVVDQAYSYSCGMNALFALAMGKVVLGGAEPESLSLYGGEQSPVINILPDVSDIVAKIETIMDKIQDLDDLGLRGRNFIQKHHDYVNIAQTYLNQWKY